MSKFISIKEASESLDVSVTTVYTYFKKGILTKHRRRIGRSMKTLVNKEEIEEILKQEEMIKQ